MTREIKLTLQNLLKHHLQQILELGDTTNIMDEDFAHEIQAKIELIDELLEKFN